MTQLQTKTMLLAGLGAMLLIPGAKADLRDQRTIFTFSDPVEIPGQVLPAGSSLFKLLDSASNRHIVQVFNKDQNHVFGTFLAIPDYRLKPSDKSIIKFHERPAGSPDAVKTWFYPGSNYGHQFVYPKSEALALAEASMLVWHKERSRLKGVSEDDTEQVGRSPGHSSPRLGTQLVPAARGRIPAGPWVWLRPRLQRSRPRWLPKAARPDLSSAIRRISAVSAVRSCQASLPCGVPIAPAVPFLAAPGCSEIPANWRQHVWSGYRGNSFQPGTPRTVVFRSRPGYGFGYGGRGGCPTCQPCQAQPAFGSAYATPARALQPIPVATRLPSTSLPPLDARPIADG